MKDAAGNFRLLLVLAAAVVLFGIILTYNTRKPPERFNESHPVKQTDVLSSSYQGEFTDAAAYPSGVQAPNMFSDVNCQPKDRLTAADLLPKDAANLQFAQTNPSGQGSLNDKNLLTAGYHVGIDTQAGSLRNANYQLRSDPPNPQLKVGPWLSSTIAPDLSRKHFEIGSN